MFQFSEDLQYLYIKNPDGSVSGIPTSQLSDEDKQFVAEVLTN